MTSTSANPPSSNFAPAAAGADTGSLADLMQAFAGWPGSGPRAATKDFVSLLAPGATRTPRAVSASGDIAAPLPAQALENAAATSRVGLWAAAQTVGATNVSAPVDAIGSAETEVPLRTEIEAAAEMMLAIVQALPAREPTVVAGTGAAQSDAETTVAVEIAGEPEFTVTLPRAKQAAASEAIRAAAARIADRQTEANSHAAPQSRGARALETLTALGAGQPPPKQMIPAAEPETVSIPPAPVQAEIQLQSGATIRFFMKAAGRAERPHETGLPKPGAEIALTSASGDSTVNGTTESLKKTFLYVVDKQLAHAASGAGIAAAKSGGNMPDQALPSLTSTIGAVKAPESAAGLLASAAGLPAEVTTESAETVETGARRAVDTAVNLMEIQAGQRGRNQSTVNVRMKLAGEDLAIRVELRDGEVRTSFQTASSELRAAISHEWQTAAAESPQRILRFHEPEFSNLDRNLSERGASEQSGRDGNAAREQAQARREAGIERGFQHRAAAASSIIPSAIAEAFAPGSMHLSTFA